MPAELSLLDQTRYLTQHGAIVAGVSAIDALARRLTQMQDAELPDAVQRELIRRQKALMRRDLDNVRQGLYPRSLLFQLPVRDYLRRAPGLFLDAPSVVRRIADNDYRDLPEHIDLSSYPKYYRRTFHWQTDGYLSRDSARRYDAGVELLFRGMADVMRRQIIPPVSRHLQQRGQPTGLRILDVATGTGRGLKQLAQAHPRQRYYGVDLSPYYLAEARRTLRGVEDLSLMAENAEQLPFPDGYFDVVVSVYLFHELPRDARRNVMRELHRVLKPGGLLVIEDSAQLSDSGQVSAALEQFVSNFHEPYYKGYIADDLGSALSEQGFTMHLEQPHLVAKVVAGQRPQ